MKVPFTQKDFELRDRIADALHPEAWGPRGSAGPTPEQAAADNAASAAAAALVVGARARGLQENSRWVTGVIIGFAGADPIIRSDKSGRELVASRMTTIRLTP